MAHPVGSVDAVPIFDARLLTGTEFPEPRLFERWKRAAELTRPSEVTPPDGDLFALHAGPVVARDWVVAPAFSHHAVMLVQADADMRLNIGGCRWETRGGPGTVCLIPAGCESLWRAATGVAESINLFLSPSALMNVAAGTLELDPRRDLLHPGLLLEDAFLCQIGSIAQSMTKSGDLCDRLYLESLAHTTALHLLEHYVDFPARARPVKGRLPIAILRQIADYVEEQPDSELTLAKLASLARLSPYHFARLFKDTTGQTVHAYVRERRLLRACYLLLTTPLPIAYVALETGFADESHFVRSFKVQFGVTPGIVRRSVLQ